MPALSRFLQRYMGWVISTSGMARGFVAQRRLLERRGLASDHTKLRRRCSARARLPGRRSISPSAGPGRCGA
eukprot:11162198-Lingulodinium_polyedra.AAC.1